MRAGHLRHRITIQDKSVAKNTYGEEVITWVKLATLWASVEPLKGSEYIEGQQYQVDVTTRVYLREYPGIRPEMRVKWTDRTGTAHYFDIDSVIESGMRGREMQLMCREAID